MSIEEARKIIKVCRENKYAFYCYDFDKFLEAHKLLKEPIL